jgi:sulfatase maturation enzyme AslB (radical SAM superfamily)
MNLPYDPKILHLEVTTHCNAKCPQCERNINGGMINPAVKVQHMDFKEFQGILGEHRTYLEKVLFCGNAGDPMMHPDIVRMLDYARSVCEKSITLGMNTNGSIGNVEQWQDIASVMRDVKDYVVFSIDGLEDTNHLYRKGTNWRTVMRNAEAFIAAGGRAHWDFLVFDHNQHQVNQAEQLAQDMGFRWFRVKETKRFKQPEIRTAFNTVLKPVEFRPRSTEYQSIHCMALEESSTYYDVQGNHYACCWVASAENLNESWGRPFRNLPWQDLERQWDPRDLAHPCTRTCGQNQGTNVYKNQWRREVEFTSN